MPLRVFTGPQNVRCGNFCRSTVLFSKGVSPGILAKFRSKEQTKSPELLPLHTGLYRVLNCSLFVYYTDCDTNPPFAVEVGDITFNQEDFRLNIDIDAVRWPNGKGIPADSPECGFDKQGCLTSSTRVTPTTPDGNSNIGRLNLK